MDVLAIIIFISMIMFYVVNVIHNKFKGVGTAYMWMLFGMHVMLTLAYMLYTLKGGSDSYAYYLKCSHADNWMTLYESGTSFISFCGYPFIAILGLSYYAVMILFSFFGYLGILLFYVIAKENVHLPIVWGKFSYIEIVFLLPNIHFWSASLGKGSVILLGLALFTYGLSRFNRRLIPIIIGAIITYMVRPHILFTMLLSVMVGVLISRSGIKGYLRWIIFGVAGIAFYFISDNVAKFTETDATNVLSSNTLAHRAEELSKAASGVDIQNYNIAMKVFTFWFRPLFFDGLGVVGFLASFENLFYIFMLFVIIKSGFSNFRHWNGFFRICFLFFLLGSVILAQVSGNLGIAMRQKAQIMPFFFIIFCKALSYREDINSSYRRS